MEIMEQHGLDSMCVVHSLLSYSTLRVTLPFTEGCGRTCLQEANKLADSIAASEEHLEELKARIMARQDWITREQENVDSKIEEATRPVAAQRTEAAEQHSTLQEEVEELR